MPLPELTRDALVRAALEVQRHAFAPYSGFFVGAALLTVEGNTFVGCNVENASYGLSICAERSAICSMVAAGDRRIAAIAIASRGGVTPCGACRQFLTQPEFGEQFAVILVDSETGELGREWNNQELLPGAFRLER